MEIEVSSINIPIDTVNLKGVLRIAGNQQGLIVFSHGSGSSRLSSRNNYIAEYLRSHRFSSLLFDLLTEEEDLIYEKRFDIDLLAKRLTKVTQWLMEDERIKDTPLGYFGASTGAASALISATQLEDKIGAIVSRGGRPDMAMSFLKDIKAPTLFIVGDNDKAVIELNNKAYRFLSGIKKIEIVEGATHLFEEPGKLDEVAILATKWFKKYLT